MRYDIDSSLGEILRRGEILAKKKHRRAACVLGSLSAVTTCLMLAVFYSITGPARAGVIGSSYGAFLLSQEAGGYVLLGLLFFVLGICFTLGALKFSKGHSHEKLMKKEADSGDKT